MIKLFLIAGLGNPEEDYSNTRHNMGFDTINKLAKQYKIEVNKNKFKGLYGIGNIENQKVVLLKPQTFMNLSGESIKEAIDFYKIQKDQFTNLFFALFTFTNATNESIYLFIAYFNTNVSIYSTFNALNLLLTSCSNIFFMLAIYSQFGVKRKWNYLLR